MKPGHFLSLAAVVAVSICAFASEHATPDEAKAMALKAAAHYREAGEVAAFSDFMKLPAWHDRDLYVFVNSNDGVTLVHGGNPALVGKNMIGLKDVTGKAFIREFASVEDQGWVDYRRRNPQTSAVEEKTSYIVRLNDHTIVGVGAYKH